MAIAFEVTAEPAAEELAFVGASLAAFNDADVGPSGRTPLAVLVRDETGKVAAGISGYTAWGWLYVQWLWVSEQLRGQGVAGRMLAAAEAEAAVRGCHGALIDTFSPVAETVYRKQGYEVFGRIADFPIGRERVFLQKRINPTPPPEAPV